VRQWSDPTGSSMIAEPRWFYDAAGNNTLVIPLIEFNSEPPGQYLSHNGLGTVQMKLIKSESNNYPMSGEFVRVSYTPDPENNHKTAWANYFHNSLNTATETPDGYVISPVNNLVIQTYNISFISV
jgi:hypothetical protein